MLSLLEEKIPFYLPGCNTTSHWPHYERGFICLKDKLNAKGSRKGMPTKLSTAVNKIQLVPNLANREAIAAFHAYLMCNDLSVHHINNNLNASIAFAIYLCSEVSLPDITSKQQVISFLDSKRKSADDDHDMKLITTRNHYLNQDLSSDGFIIGIKEVTSRRT
jgi:hypothetical protein